MRSGRAPTRRRHPDLTQVVARPGTPVTLSEHFLDAAEVARRAVAGIERDMPVIVSHPGLLPLVEEFCGRIVAAFREDPGTRLGA